METFFAKRMEYTRFHPETGYKEILTILLILSTILLYNRIHSSLISAFSRSTNWTAPATDLVLLCLLNQFFQHLLLFLIELLTGYLGPPGSAVERDF